LQVCSLLIDGCQPFLRHYDRCGITDFFIAAFPDFVPIVRNFMNDYRILLFAGLDVADSVSGGSAAVTEMRRVCQRDGEWVVIVDLDEFVEFPRDIRQIVSAAERDNANVVRGMMYDRFALDGKLVDPEQQMDFIRLFPIKARFIDRVMHGWDYKGILVKGHLRAAIAHHTFEGENLFSEVLEIAHYKWITGAIDKLKSATHIVEDAGIPWHIEYKRALDHYERFGRFAWETFGGEMVDTQGSSRGGVGG